MSKSIVVINTPKNCRQCPFRESPWSFCLGEYEKEKHCPLKPMPDKKGEISIDDTKISLKVNNYIIIHKINFEKAILYAKQRAFNACIDEILGADE